MLTKDVLKLCLLHMLSEQDQYGYEILRVLHERFSDIQESAMYALLRSLCRESCLETYTGDTSGGPPRKYYRITQKGRKKLNDLLSEWRALLNAMEGVGIK